MKPLVKIAAIWFAVYAVVGLIVTLVAVSMFIGISVLNHWSTPTFDKVYLWTCAVWVTVVLLYFVWWVRHNYIASGFLAKMWEAPREQVADAIANFDLATVDYRHWDSAKFAEWYESNKFVRQLIQGV